MTTNKPQVWLILLTFVTVLMMTSGCYALFDDAKEIEKNDEYRSYAINSMTILESLDRGDTNVFMLLEATPKASTSQPSNRVSWHQADYFRVAQALHQQSRQEALGEQNLYFMSFTMDCAEIEQGTYTDATFSSFKIITNGKEETRVQYSIVIKPSENLVRTYKGEFTPNIKIKEPLNLTQYRISAEEALQIAEKNGGAEERLSYKNNCEIYSRAPVSDANGWEVSYSNNRDQMWRTIFDIVIDSQSGTFKVLFPK